MPDPYHIREKQNVRFIFWLMSENVVIMFSEWFLSDVSIDKNIKKQVLSCLKQFVPQLYHGLICLCTLYSEEIWGLFNVSKNAWPA